ncbi:hypothetical protein B5F33_01825 [Collinsella sp. An2]|nr:hypothetical protein B5F33_01825 [Collinsella sp. An2]
MPHVLVYFSYVLSAWALVIWVARLVRANPVASVRRAAEHNNVLARILNDTHLRLGLTTTLSFAIDVLWTASNAIAAAANSSAWFSTLAAYYAALAVMRAPLSFSILRHSDGRQTAQQLHHEQRICRACGALLLLCTPVFAGLIVLALHRESAISHSGYLIYGIALYAFYSLIGGIVKFVRERHSPHPAARAANALYLVVASVSMLSLEISMIDTFSTANNEGFRSPMIMLTGAAVCVFAVIVAIWIVRDARPGTHAAQR